MCVVCVCSICLIPVCSCFVKSTFALFVDPSSVERSVNFPGMRCSPCQVSALSFFFLSMFFSFILLVFGLNFSLFYLCVVISILSSHLLQVAFANGLGFGILV